MNFKTINLDQQSDEWREWRRLKIGASDIGSILGINPWEKPFSLWKRKLGLIQEKARTPAMQRGIDVESKARESFNKEFCYLSGLDLKMIPQVLQSLENDFMIASLDGVDHDNKCVLEIKCPGKKVIEDAKIEVIPEMYKAQIQHQLYVTGYDLGYYYCFDGENGITLEVMRDDEMIDKIIKKCKRFYNSIIDMEPLKEWLSKCNI